MNAIIIFPADEGHCAFVYPSDEFPWDDIASQIPEGKPYRIIPEEHVPTDHTFFSAFEHDFTNPDGIGTRK